MGHEDEDPVLQRFEELLTTGQVVHLNAACPLSLTGLQSLQDRGLLRSGERKHIEAQGQICKGNTSGFSSYDAFHAHCR